MYPLLIVTLFKHTFITLSIRSTCTGGLFFSLRLQKKKGGSLVSGALKTSNKSFDLCYGGSLIHFTKQHVTPFRIQTISSTGPHFSQIYVKNCVLEILMGSILTNGCCNLSIAFICHLRML